MKFERVAKGVYRTIDSQKEQSVLIEGNGRNLSMLKDKSIDCILTDHPWLDKKSNKVGTRNFAEYMCFRYTLDDFKEKARVLKDGCFLPCLMFSQYLVHQSKLPVELCEEILEYVTYEGEIVLDSFAGSGAVGVAALNKKRSCILIER